jgi:hypothetical protein
MRDLTDEEYDKLDELVTKSVPKTDPTRPGIALRRKAARMVQLDDFAADYLLTRSKATHQSPSAIITAMVRQQIAAAL